MNATSASRAASSYGPSSCGRAPARARCATIVRPKRVVDRQHVLRSGWEEIEFVQLEQPRELVDRCGMIVDAQVDVAI
ncbi:hypothetical protein [Vulcanimicrobium alpinum]|uniref:hypothetical protein n=1 Tax=Vulcanimicrobium alpinum TaxID=3016050 RepID=UPI00295EA237|nr:hypothetical protein [Vulcanimicrobium alpinum]